MTAIKMAVGTIAATAVIPEAVNTIVQTEQAFLGIPYSVFYVSLSGCLIGFLLLSDKDASRTNPQDCQQTKTKIKQFIVRWGMLAFFLCCWAILSAWLVLSIGHFMPAFEGAPQLPLAGLSGALIRRFLPKYLEVVERRTDSIGDKK